jgi:hypothetical protein
MKFNVIVTCKNRKQHLMKCLEYLAYANRNKQQDVNVYVAYSGFRILNTPNTIKVIKINIKDKEEHFCKSRYINEAMKKMRKDYHWFVQWDCDLIASPFLFSLINIEGKDWTVLSGFKLTKEASQKALKSKEELDLDSLGLEDGTKFENSSNRYVGMVAIRKNTLERYMAIMDKEKLFDERFVGHGGEDSELSITSTKLASQNYFTKNTLYRTWRHLYHESMYNRQLHTKNVELLNNLLIRFDRRMQETGQ